MKTHFAQVSTQNVAFLAAEYTPDVLARDAVFYGNSHPISACTAALASIRARGNWMLVNGQWYRKG